MNAMFVRKCLNLYKVIVAFTALMVLYLAHHSKKVVTVHVAGKSDNQNKESSKVRWVRTCPPHNRIAKVKPYGF